MGTVLNALTTFAPGTRSATISLDVRPVISPIARGSILQTATVEESLKRIGELYAVEEEIRGHPATERLAARRSRSKPLLISLHDLLAKKSATLSKKSRLDEAFAYVLNQWDALCYYCDDGLAEPDNNAA